MWTLRVTLCCLLQSGFVTEPPDMSKSALPIILKAWELEIDWLPTALRFCQRAGHGCGLWKTFIFLPVLSL